MLKTVGGATVAFLFCAAAPQVVRAQAAVEVGLGAARAATTTAPARGIGNSMAGAWGALGNVIKTAGDTSQTPAAAPAVAPGKKSGAKDATPPKRLPVYEDPSRIRVGIAYDELVRRFGPPAMEVTGPTSRTLEYAGKENSAHVEVADGKVSSATVTRHEQAAVTLPGK